jgi:hypothetical protein
LLALAVVPAARAGFWGRDRLTSAWTASPVKIDGDDEEWPQIGAFEDNGVGVQALNDGAKLYLKATSSTREGRAQLIGLARQDVTFWFFRGDGLTRAWGLRVPFSRLKPPDEDELRYGPVVSGPNNDLTPELLIVSAVAGSTATVVSTAPWPTDMEFRLGFSGRRPVWELSLPLARLTPDLKHNYPIDFVVAGKSARLGPQRPAGSSKPGERGTLRPGGRSADPGGPTSAEPFEFNMSLRLAPDPATLRVRGLDGGAAPAHTQAADSGDP